MYYLAIHRDPMGLWLLAHIASTLTATWFGLCAVWIALGRRPHWFLRVALAAVPVAAWLVVPAYDMCWSVLVEWAVILPPLLLARWWTGGPWSARSKSDDASGHALRCGQFTIADLLLGTVVVAAICVLAAYAPLSELTGRPWAIYCGIGAGVAVLIGVWSALGRRAPWARVALPILVPYALPTVAWLLLWRWQTRRADWAGSRWRRQIAGLSLAAVTLLLVVPWAGSVAMLARLAPIPDEGPTEDNGYPELVVIGKAFHAQLQLHGPQVGFLHATASARRNARHAMDKPYWHPVPIDESSAPRALQGESDVEWVAMAFLLEGGHAAAKGRTGEALASYRDILRLVRLEASGGYSGRTTGWDSWGLRETYLLRERMTAAQCREMIPFLEEQSRFGVPSEKNLARYAAYIDRVVGWEWRLRACWQTILRSGSWSPDHLYCMENRLLMAELGLRAYHAERGGWPEDLSQLVPDYLPAVPIDPFSGQPLIYRLNGSGYVLYSVGYDGSDDDGAEPGSLPIEEAEQCDLSLDWMYRMPRPNLPTKHKTSTWHSSWPWAKRRRSGGCCTVLGTMAPMTTMCRPRHFRSAMRKAVTCPSTG